MTLGGCADFCVGDRLDAFPAPGWRDQPTPAVVWAGPRRRERHGSATGRPRSIDPRLWTRPARPVPPDGQRNPPADGRPDRRPLVAFHPGTVSSECKPPCPWSSVKGEELPRQGGKYTDTAERRPGFTLVFLIPLTADPGVERETIGPGHPLQSGIRSVQRADGADHESFTSLLWADGYSVGDGTAQNLRQGPPLFMGVASVSSAGSRSSQALSVSCFSKPWRSRQPHFR